MMGCVVPFTTKLKSPLPPVNNLKINNDQSKTLMLLSPLRNSKKMCQMQKD